MPLKTTPTSRCLDRKLKLFGLEILDLFLVLFALCCLNLLFGNTGLSLPLVWGPSVSLALLLRWGKRGKPDHYLLHWMKYQCAPSVYTAFEEPSGWVPPPHVRSDASLKAMRSQTQKEVANA